MNNQSKPNKSSDELAENARRQSDNQADSIDKTGKKALIIDSNGFAKEIGQGRWRKYDPGEDQ